ncbi:hypothetical protein OAA99_00880, partial [Omnitrophica bacterium]|nr:hypothetical protein [Candidatus Omnitrophota bacterium]
MKSEKRDNIISLMSNKYAMHTRVVAWLLILCFTINNAAYGYDRKDALRAIREAETAGPVLTSALNSLRVIPVDGNRWLERLLEKSQAPAIRLPEPSGNYLTKSETANDESTLAEAIKNARNLEDVLSEMVKAKSPPAPVHTSRRLAAMSPEESTETEPAGTAAEGTAGARAKETIEQGYTAVYEVSKECFEKKQYTTKKTNHFLSDNGTITRNPNAILSTGGVSACAVVSFWNAKTQEAALLHVKTDTTKTEEGKRNIVAFVRAVQDILGPLNNLDIRIFGSEERISKKVAAQNIHDLFQQEFSYTIPAPHDYTGCGFDDFALDCANQTINIQSYCGPLPVELRQKADFVNEEYEMEVVLPTLMANAAAEGDSPATDLEVEGDAPSHARRRQRGMSPEENAEAEPAGTAAEGVAEAGDDAQTARGIPVLQSHMGYLDIGARIARKLSHGKRRSSFRRKEYIEMRGSRYGVSTPHSGKLCDFELRRLIYYRIIEKVGRGLFRTTVEYANASPEDKRQIQKLLNHLREHGINAVDISKIGTGINHFLSRGALQRTKLAESPAVDGDPAARRRRGMSPKENSSRDATLYGQMLSCAPHVNPIAQRVPIQKGYSAVCINLDRAGIDHRLDTDIRNVTSEVGAFVLNGILRDWLSREEPTLLDLLDETEQLQRFYGDLAPGYRNTFPPYFRPAYFTVRNLNNFGIKITEEELEMLIARLPEGITAEELKKYYGVPDELLKTSDAIKDLVLGGYKFRVRSAVNHVIGEEERVQKAFCALSDEDAASFGKILYEIYGSLRDNLGVIDAQTKTLIEDILMPLDYVIGAVPNDRGWGGVIYVWVRDEDRTRLAAHIKEDFFKKQPQYAGLSDQELDQRIIVTQVGLPAGLFSLQKEAKNPYLANIDMLRRDLDKAHSPICSHLKEIYGEHNFDMQRERFSTALERFAQLYPDVKSVVVARSGGRAILAGHHYSFNHGNIITTSILNDTLVFMGVNPQSTSINLNNMMPEFDSLSVPSIDEFDIHAKEPQPPHWTDYALSTLMHLNSVLSEQGLSIPGLSIVVDSRPEYQGLPIAIGLSSSTAMEVSLILATTGIFDTREGLSATQIAKICIDAESSIGFTWGWLDPLSVLFSPDFEDPKPSEDATSGRTDQRRRGMSPESRGVAIIDSPGERIAVLKSCLRHILDEEKRPPLISMDLDKTIIPLKALIADYEDALEGLIAYVEAGGYLAFNTLADKQRFYRRVLDTLAQRLHDVNKSHLLNRIFLILSEGSYPGHFSTIVEIYGYEGIAYRLLHRFDRNSKADGLSWLIQEHLDSKVSLLAVYGDRLGEFWSDGNAIGRDDVP